MLELLDVGSVKIESNGGTCHVQWKIQEFVRYIFSDNRIWFSAPFKLWERWWYFSCSPYNDGCCLCLRTSHQRRYQDTKCCTNRESCKEQFSIPTMHFIWEIKMENGTTYASSERKSAHATSFAWRSPDLSGFRKKKDTFLNDCVIFSITIFPEREITVTTHQECKTNEEEIDEEEEEEENEYFDSSDAVVLAQNLKDFYLSEQDSDATVKVEEREFKAHKAILCARSTVLASMFKHDMEESRSGVIKISDCDPDAFQHFLRYLYTAKVDNFSKINVSALYVIADKYNVKELALKCVKYMVNRVNVDSFCDFFAIAVKYNESELMEVVEKYFANHMHQILVTLKWQSFIKENPIVANELFIKFSSKLSFG